MDKKSTTPKRRENALHAQQIHQMRNLSPRAAAWLAEVPTSTIRDATATLPPDRDGNFDARVLMRWVAARRLVKIEPAELEMIYRSVDLLITDPGSGYLAVARVARELRGKYGRMVDGLFLDVLIGEAEVEGIDPPLALRSLSDKELLRRAREAYDCELDRRSRERLEVASICRECGRRRVGNKWIKRRSQPVEQTMESLCDDCSGVSFPDPFTLDVAELMT